MGLKSYTLNEHRNKNEIKRADLLSALLFYTYLKVFYYEQPLVEPQLIHLRHVPLRTIVA